MLSHPGLVLAALAIILGHGYHRGDYSGGDLGGAAPGRHSRYIFHVPSGYALGGREAGCSRDAVVGVIASWLPLLWAGWKGRFGGSRVFGSISMYSWR